MKTGSYFENMTQGAIAEREGVSLELIRQRKAQALNKLRSMPDVRMLREEQHIERSLHFDSRANGEAYFIAQRKIAEILKRGSYLSYGQRQAIIYDCKMKSSAEYKKLYAEYQAFEELERAFAGA
ncbi:MAG: sigma factor-like helix-turn-helix DNA-binding protein [Hominimerdicola sp.]